MKQERKQLAVKILADSHAKLLAIQEETGLSQAKVLEMLLANYGKPLVTSETTSNPLVLDEEKVLAKLLAQVQVLVKEQVKTEVAKMKELLVQVEDWEDDEPMIDESPILPEPTTEDFYGKIPPVNTIPPGTNPLDLIAELDNKPKEKPLPKIDPYDMF